MKKAFAIGLVAAASCAWANPKDPQISNFVVAHSAGRSVTVSYDLDEDAYVTIDVLTNGVSIGGANIIANLTGDVNTLVTAGEGKSIVWNSRKAWPDHEFADGSLKVRLTAWATDCPPRYLAMDMATGRIDAYASADFVPGGITDDVYKTTKLLLRKIDAAGKTFLMGATAGEKGRTTNDGSNYGTWGHPATVMLTKDYYIGVYEMTQRQVKFIDNSVHGTFTKADAYPADGCSWDQIRGGKFYAGGADNAIGANSHMAWLRNKSGNRLPFDLPTEAQWEFACRAGTTTAIYSGFELSDTTTDAELGKIAWYAGNGGKVEGTNKGPTKVGSKEPNAWGLYDMLGNLGELCLDRLSWNQATMPLDTRKVNVDPCGWRQDEQTSGGAERRIRGGSWCADAEHCRCGARSNGPGSLGKDATNRTGNWMSGYRVTVTFE